MKKDNINYFIVGIFVIIGMLLLLVMLLKITGDQSDSDEYYVEFDNVTGIKDGITVSYGGYAIGAVKGVEPLFEDAKTRYKLALWIKSGWQIPLDSTAQIVMPAIIADKQIEITQGIEKNMLSPGDTIQGVETVDIMQLVDSIAQELNRFVPESTKNINHLLKQLNHTADQVAIILSKDNVRHLNNLFRNADSSSRSLSELADGFTKINKQLDNILTKTDLLIDDNSSDIRYSVIELKQSIDIVSGRIESIMHNLDASSQNMNEFSRTLRNNPGAILGGKPPVDQHVDR